MSEKRHFKIYSSKHVIGGRNEYVLLFDAIAKQKEYDESSLKKEGFVKNLPAEKNYLYRLVLRSLNSFHDQSSAKSEVYSLLKNVDVLYHKGLYEQALKLTKKARKLASANELFVQELAINELEVELLSKQFQYLEASQLIEQANELIGKLENFNNLQKITTDCYQARLEMGTSRSEEDSIRLAGFLDVDDIGQPSYPQTKRAEMYQLGLQLTYFYFVSDQEKMLELTEKMTALYEDNPHLIEYSTIGYVSSLYNLHNAYNAAGKKKKAEEILVRLEESRTKYGIPTSDNIGARVFFYATNIRLDKYLKQDRYEEAGQLISSFDKDVKRFTPRIGKPQLYEFYFLMAKYAFVTSDFRLALRYTNFILNDLQFKVRADLLSVVRLLNLLIHYELGNDLTLDYVAKNTMNYLKKRKRLFKVEGELIRFINHHHKIDSTEERLADLAQLGKAMSEFKDDQYERIPFNHFDFEYWAKAKVEQRSILSFGR